MTSSNSSEPVSATGAEAASAAQTAPESTTQTTGATQAPQAASAAPQGTMADAAAQAEQVAPQFQPNFKFKAFGKEHELEEFWRPLVKDQDSEKKVKDLFTRAYAFDDLKSRFDGTQKEYESVFQEYTALDRDVRRVTNYLNRGDLDNFFRSIGLNEEKIYEWVEQKIQNQNLPPEQRRQLESQAQERQRAYDLEMENQEWVDRYQNQAVEARKVQLDMVMSRPEVASAASAWDSRMGQLGAFTSLVVEEAQKAWFVEKVDLSAEQAVQRVLTKYGKLIDTGMAAPQAPVPTPNGVPGQSQAPQAQAKPVIPAVNGRGTSPVKKSPQSLDDLRAMAKELGA